MTENYFKLSEEDKQLIQEISVLSGYGQNIIKECFDFMLINWTIKMAQNDGKRAPLHVPFLGTVGVRYEGDEIQDTGELITDVSALVALNPALKKLVGETHDEGQSVVTRMLKQKIKNTVVTATESDPE